MSDISVELEKFARITGRHVSDFDKKRIQAISDAFKIESDDAFFQLIVLLDMYWGIYEQYPEKIRYAIKRIESEGSKQIGKIRIVLNDLTEQTCDHIKNEISTTAKRETKKVQEMAEKAEKNRWWLSLRARIVCFTAAFVSIFVLICGTAWFSYNEGRNVSYTLSQEKENYISAFMNTHLFQDVYQMYQDGTLDDLVHCKMDGWRIIDGYCYAYPPGYGKIRFDVASWSIPE